MKNIIGVFFFVFIFSFQNVYALIVSGEVKHIHDGDTITVLLDGATKNKAIRLLGIDTPEIDFNGHSQGEVAILARDYLRAMLPIGARVDIEVFREKDLEYRRILGTVFYNNQDMNLLMVESGWAATYFIYPFKMKMVRTYSKASTKAMSLRLGIFKDYNSDSIMPYEFRIQAQKRTPTNYVGDIKTMKLYRPSDAYKVSPDKRVFIRHLDSGERLGFSFSFD